MQVLAVAGLAGLLIWAKLRLVTDFPRTVQADPEAAETEAATGPTADSAPTHSGREPAPEDPVD